jgi:uncharacterized membrane protein
MFFITPNKQRNLGLFMLLAECCSLLLLPVKYCYYSQAPQNEAFGASTVLNVNI